nr:zinc finger, CCHC-type [Tanacetum cinerariifolium]
MFDGNRFSSISIPSLRIPKGTENIDVLEVSDEVPPGVTEEVADEVFVQQHEPKLQRSSRHRTPMDAMFDGNRFSSISIPSLRIPKGTENIDVLEVSDEVPPGVTEEVADEVFVQQHEPKLQRSSRHRTPMLTRQRNFSLRFSMKDMEEADDILGIKIKHETAGKKAQWLKNLLLEIPLWPKPIAPIFIRHDNATTLAKAYSHMYNGKFR